jgi:hypothetical protein
MWLLMSAVSVNFKYISELANLSETKKKNEFPYGFFQAFSWSPFTNPLPSD